MRPTYKFYNPCVMAIKGQLYKLRYTNKFNNFTYKPINSDWLQSNGVKKVSIHYKILSINLFIYYT